MIDGWGFILLGLACAAVAGLLEFWVLGQRIQAAKEQEEREAQAERQRRESSPP